MKKGFIKAILRSNKTVFTFKDLLLMWEGIDADTAKKRVNYYVQTGSLYAIRRGVYAKDKNYDRFELATKIFTPAYISFETVLGHAGITFQYYSQIFVATYQTKEIMVDQQKLVFKTLKSSLLTNSAGIENRENYAIAIPERAFLDVVYLSKDYHFDNLSSINWDKVNEILPIYGENKRMSNRVNKYYKFSKEQ
ncbi:MAG: hypothetical protein ABFD50_14800 [Smithella sp.]